MSIFRAFFMWPSSCVITIKKCTKTRHSSFPSCFGILIDQKSGRCFIFFLAQCSFYLCGFDLDLFGRFVVGIDIASQQFLPIQSIEEEVFLELFVATALTVLRTTTEQLLDECLAALGTVSRVLHTGVYDLFVDGKWILRSLSERQFSTEELVGYDTEGPQIHLEAVAFSCDDLWGHVMRGAYDGIGSESSLDLQFLSCAHIDQSKEPIDIHHQIFWLEIPVDNAIGMQMFHHEQDLRCQLPGMFRGEGQHLGDDVEEIFSLDELHDEVDEVAVFYQLVEGHHEGEARDCPQDLFLVHYVLDYLRFLDVGTVQHFYCINPLSFYVPTCVDFAEIALTQLADHMEIGYLHFLFQGSSIFLASFFTPSPNTQWRRGYFQLIHQLPNETVIRGHHIFLDPDRLHFQQLSKLNDGIRLIGEGGSFEFGIEQDIDASLMIATVLENSLSFLESQEFAGLCCSFQLCGVKSLIELALVDDLPHDIAFDDIFQAVSETSFDVLARHGDDDATGFSHEGVGTDAALDQDGVLAEAVHFLQLVVLFFNQHCTLFDDIEGIGIITLIEDNLSFLIGLSQAGTGKGILLLLCKFLEEGEHIEKLLILFLMLLVDLLHNLQEDPPIYLGQFAISEGQDRCRSWCVIDDAQITKGIAIGKCSFLFSVDFHLAHSFQDDIIGPALIALFEDVVVPCCHAGLHFLHEAPDL